MNVLKVASLKELREKAAMTYLKRVPEYNHGPARNGFMAGSEWALAETESPATKKAAAEKTTQEKATQTKVANMSLEQILQLREYWLKYHVELPR